MKMTGTESSNIFYLKNSSKERNVQWSDAYREVHTEGWKAYREWLDLWR